MHRRGPIGRGSAPYRPLRASRRPGQAQEAIVSTPLDPFLPLKALASYSGLSVRKLRDYLTDPAHPLPCYRVGGKILVRRWEFDAWVACYRQVGQRDVDGIVSEVLGDFVGR